MFENFILKSKEQNLAVYGIEVFHKGQIVDKYDFVKEARHPIYSATKTFTSTAVGIAISEGKFSIDASLYDYLKADIPVDCSSQQCDTLRRITIKRLLTMSVPGYPFRPEGDDWLKFSLLYPIQYTEIPTFDYSNIPAYLVGVAVERAVGEPLDKYLEKRLFMPLGIKNVEFMNCPSGHFYGAGGMFLTINELARLGQVYLQNGMYNGQRIVPSQWVQEATSIQQMNREGGYGYYFWKYKDGYRISGKWGQRCFVFPKHQLMITYLSDIREKKDVVMKLVEEEIISEYIGQERKED